MGCLDGIPNQRFLREGIGLNRFLNYVEIKTKITSLFAFFLGLGYLVYLGHPIRWDLTGIFFASMFLFDLTTTAVNNYIDTKTNDQILPFARKPALAILLTLFALSALLGLYLAYRTGIVVLLAGGLCFLAGILYTAGPVPISRQPWGELMSGLFYGLFLPFILLYINLPRDTFLTIVWNGETLNLDFQAWPWISLLLLSLPPVCATANIMLANNICDVENDAKVRRYTLPYYLGHSALHLFAGLYYLAYLSVVAMAALRILPAISLISLLTLIPVQKNIRRFYQKQEKASTFIVSIQNYVLIMGSVGLLVWAGGLLRL